MGSWAAFAGASLFAWFAHVSWGFAGGAAAVTLLGFGLGQIMSSVNLMAGSGPAGEQTGSLARLSAAWCIGAILSPLLTTVLLTAVTPAMRLALFAPCFLVPLLSFRGERVQSIQATETAESGASSVHSGVSGPVILCTMAFMLYSGAEASINGWLPLFATRYNLGSLGTAQWMNSLFWGGLIVGRITAARFVTPAGESSLLNRCVIAAVCCLLWLIAFPSALTVMAGSVLAGMCLGPVFPLMLSLALACRFSTRCMGVALAACGAGAALLPSLLGAISASFSLRAGMAVPMFALFGVLLLRWQPHLLVASVIRAHEGTKPF